MKRAAMGAFLLLGVLLGTAPGQAAAQAEAIRTERGRVLLEGAFFDTLPQPGTRTVEVAPGEVWEVALSSDDFDTLLRVAAGTDTLENDDWGGTTDSRIRFTVPDRVHSLTAIPARYSPGSQGRFTLTLTRVGVGARSTMSGKVGPASPTSPKGERHSAHQIEVDDRSPLEVSLTESSGEASLFLKDPSGRVRPGQYVAEGNQSVSVPVSEPGTWTAYVVAPAWVDHVVDYSLTVVRLTETVGTRTREGSLEPGDSISVRGEYFDIISHEHPGGPLDVQLLSQEFDTYLAILLSDGTRHTNDDASSGGSEISLLDAPVGPVTIYVTSFGPAETGRYDLVITSP